MRSGNGDQLIRRSALASLGIAAVMVIPVSREASSSAAKGKSPESASPSVPAARPVTDAPAHVLEDVFTIARSHVIREGDKNAAMSADVVRTTRRQALGAMAMETGDDAGDVWAFRFAGHFSANKAPPGTPFPTGRFMVILVDVSSGRALDLAILDERPNFERVGPLAPITG
jgi:hypothetical protein